MTGNNTTHQMGTLISDPFLNRSINDSGVSYLRFHLAVPRSADQQPRIGLVRQKVDMIRVVQYGVTAEINYHYLVKGAQVGVTGWIQSRIYADREARKKHCTWEVNAQAIVFSRGCLFESGDLQRQKIAEREGWDTDDSRSSSSSLSPVNQSLLQQLAMELAGTDGF